MADLRKQMHHGGGGASVTTTRAAEKTAQAASVSPLPPLPPPPTAVESEVEPTAAQPPSAYNRLLSMLNDHETKSHGNDLALQSDLLKQANFAAPEAHFSSAPDADASGAAFDRRGAGSRRELQAGQAAAPAARAPATSATAAPPATRKHLGLRAFAGLHELTANVPTPQRLSSQSGGGGGGFGLLARVMQHPESIAQAPSPVQVRAPMQMQMQMQAQAPAVRVAEENISPPPLPPAAEERPPPLSAASDGGNATLSRFLNFVERG